MAKKKVAKKRKKKSAKAPSEGQQHIDGFEPPRIRELDVVGLKLVKIAADQKKLRDAADAEQAKAVELLHKHGLEVYPVPDTVFEMRLKAAADESVSLKQRREQKKKKKKS